MCGMMTRAFLLCLLLWTVACAKKDTPQAALESKFQETMTGATLAGTFTLSDRPGKTFEERYTINKVTKVAGDTWLFNARIKYGSRDVTVPIPLAVKWAGDTPVITLTDLAIPGLGTFTARVMIFRGQYAGTWSGKDHGGHLFGKVEKGI